MTKEETKKIMAILEVAYPNFYKGADLSAKGVALSLWADMFANDPAKIVGMAVKALIATCKFPPTIAEVREYIQRLTQPDRPQSAEAWEMVRRALNSPDVHYGERGWDYTKAYDKLPRQVKAVVGSPAQLAAYGNMAESSLEQFERPRFCRLYDEQQAKADEYARLPEAVRQKSEQLKGVPIGDLLAEAKRRQIEGGSHD